MTNAIAAINYLDPENPEEGLKMVEAGQELCATVGRRVYEGLALLELGLIHNRLGGLAKAHEYMGRASMLFGRIDSLHLWRSELALAQLALASFSNPSGLLSTGNSRYRATNASGTALIGLPNTAGRGGVAAGTLEMSNVDLSEEFTQLIIAQRGFQANSRIITVSDEMIQELVNLKR